MATVRLDSIVQTCDKLLKTGSFKDYEGAANGLQVQNNGQVTRIAAAVDASLVTVRMAVEAESDLLVVHHGLFWGKSHPWTGRKYKLLTELISNNVAVYSSHLPLDAHPNIGNNAGLAKTLSLKNLKPFFFEKEQNLGFRSSVNLSRAELTSRLGKIFGKSPTVLPGGPARCRQIGIVTGGAGASLATAAREGVDTFITGEGPHWTYALAEDLGINVFYCGHYATETFGVKSLAAHLSKKFGVPWMFLDHPTGL